MNSAFVWNSVKGILVLSGRSEYRYYKGCMINCGYRMDLLVDDLVVLELKAVSTLERIHEAQLLTYLKLSGKRLGILMNFNVVLLRNGIKRVVNGL